MDRDIHIHESLVGKAASGLYQQLLAIVRERESISGALVVDNEGCVLAFQLPEGTDASVVAESARNIFSDSERMVQRLNLGRLYQTAYLTSDGYLKIDDFGNGLLVTLSYSDTSK